MPKKIAVLITQGFEDTEYLQTVQALNQADYQCIHVDQHAGGIVHGLHSKTAVTIDQSLSNLHLDDFDAVLIPGGQSPVLLAQNPAALTLIQRCIHDKKIIMSLSSASLLLLKANVLAKRLITTPRSFAAALSNAGAYYYDAELVNDNNQIISCRGTQDLTVFIHECLEVLSSLSFYPIQLDSIAHTIYAH